MIRSHNRPPNYHSSSRLEESLRVVQVACNIRKDDLKRYEASANPKQHYLQKENEFLRKVTTLIEGLSRFHLLNLWEQVEQAMQLSYETDPTVSGFDISLTGLPANGFRTRLMYHLQPGSHD